MFQEALKLSGEEETVPDNDSIKLQKVLAETAIKTISAPDNFGQFTFMVFWCLRCICRKDLALEKTEKICESLIALRNTLGWEYFQYSVWFFLNQRDSLKLAKSLPQVKVPQEEPLLLKNELTRHLVHIGDYSAAEKRSMSFKNQYEKSDDDMQRFIYELRLVRIHLGQGRFQAANDSIRVLRKSFPKLRTKYQERKLAGFYWRTVTRLLWAQMEINAEEPCPRSVIRILRCLRSSVRYDFPVIVMLACSLLGEILLRKKIFPEAYTLWHYLWQAAEYLQHPVMMIMACNGMSESVLWLKEDDVVITNCFEKAYAFTKKMPGRRCELLVGRAFHHLLKSRRHKFENDLAEAKDIAEQYDLSYLSFKVLELDLLYQANIKGVGTLLFQEDDKPEAEKILPGINRYRKEQRNIWGIRGFYKWKHDRMPELLKEYKDVFKNK